LDDEITLEYADSSRLSGDAILDFFDSEESNAHLEVMRLRGQTLSSLYGYAGIAINPHSYISLFDFDLGNALPQQHLDKMFEFHEVFIAWQEGLPTKLKLVRAADGTMLNLSRVNASLYLIYHQVSPIPNGGLRHDRLHHTGNSYITSTCISQYSQRMVCVANEVVFTDDPCPSASLGIKVNALSLPQRMPGIRTRDLHNPTVAAISRSTL
jgi:hypothetical protein